MSKFMWVLLAGLCLLLVAIAGCGKKPSQGSRQETTLPPTVSTGVVYRLAEHWAEVEKSWQLYGQQRVPCQEGWISPVPQLYPNGVPSAKYQTITDTVISAHPAYSKDRLVGETFLSFSTTLPQKPVKLTFGIFLLKTGPLGDGVQFRVRVDGATVFSELTNAYEPQMREADLAPYAGKTVKVELITDPGPRKNISVDWALWVDPKIVTES